MTLTLCWIGDVGQLYMELPNYSWKILLHQRISLGTTVNSRATCPNIYQPGATIVCRTICIYIYVFLSRLWFSSSTRSAMDSPSATNVNGTLPSLQSLFAMLIVMSAFIHHLQHGTKGSPQLIKYLTEYCHSELNPTIQT